MVGSPAMLALGSMRTAKLVSRHVSSDESNHVRAFLRPPRETVVKRLRIPVTPGALLIVAQESHAELSASVLQAFLRASPGIAPRACGRRCLAGNHLRTWCPPNKPARLGSGSGDLSSDSASAGVRPYLTSPSPS